MDDLINDLIDTIIDELKTYENFNFSNSKIFDLIKAENLKKLENMVNGTKKQFQTMSGKIMKMVG